MPLPFARALGNLGASESGEFPQRRFTFGENPDEEQARSGASALHSAYAQALAMEQHRIAQEYERLHYNLELARYRREEAQLRAQSEERMKHEAILEKVLPQLHGIDPGAKDAAQQRAAIYRDNPQIFHTDEGAREVDRIERNAREADAQHQRLQEEAEKQGRKSAMDSQWKEAAPKLASINPADPDAREQYMKLGSDYPLLFNSDHQGATVFGAKLKYAQALADKSDKEKAAQAKLNTPTPSVQSRYLESSKAAEDLKSRLDKTQSYIDEQEAKGEKIDDVSQKNLQNLLRSREKLQADYNKHSGIVQALELVHPQLNPSFKADATDSTGDKKADDAARGAAAEERDTKAVGGDTPPTPAAPVSGGTATPSGEMAPLKDASQTPPDNPIIADAAKPAPVVSPATSPADAAPPVAQPHPLEGKRVLQKSTGKYGTFTNGQFVPES